MTAQPLRQGSESPPVTSRTRKIPKFSLEHLLAEKLERQDKQERFKACDALAQIEVTDDILQNAGRNTLLDEALGNNTADALAHIVQTGHIARLPPAYFYFSQRLGRRDLIFPNEQANGWLDCLQDPERRMLHFKSGYIQRMLTSGENTPLVLVHWMLSELAFETSQQLASSYASIIKAYIGSNHWKPSNLIWDKVLNTVTALGGDTALLRIPRKIYLLTNVMPKYLNTGQYAWRLALVFDICVALLQTNKLSIDVLYDMFKFIMLVSMDSILTELISPRAEFSLDQLLQHCPHVELSGLVSHVTTWLISVTSSNLVRYRALRILPATSERGHLVRRHMAAAAFFENKDFKSKLNSDASLVPNYTARILELSTSNEDGWLEIQLLIRLLDLALDDPHNQLPRDQAETLAETINNKQGKINDSRGILIERSEAKSLMQKTSIRMKYQLKLENKNAIDRFFVPRRMLLEPELNQLSNILLEDGKSNPIAID